MAGKGAVKDDDYYLTQGWGFPTFFPVPQLVKCSVLFIHLGGGRCPRDAVMVPTMQRSGVIEPSLLPSI